MKLIYSDDHKGHKGAMELRYDKLIPMSENPERMDMIINALSDIGYNDII